MAELEVSSLCRKYGDVLAVDNVSFKVHEGEFLTLLGPSGCGKSTTLAAIAGLEPPTSGRISLGASVYFDSATGIHLPPERRNCGLVFQSYALWPHMSVEQNCAFPLKLRKISRQMRSERVREALALVEMEHLADSYPHQLSGGQQQRVALARTLVFRPDVLLLDEPLSNLDAKLRDRARTWLKHLQTKVGLTTVYVTHDQVEALAMSDRIAVMNGGRIVQIDTPKRIYGSPANQFVADFIGTSNLINASLARVGQATMARYADGQQLALPADISGNDGLAIMTAIRPESIRLTQRDIPLEASPATRILGRIVEQSYLGARYSYTVETLGSILRVESTEDLPNGDVAIHVPAEAIVTFAAGGAQLQPA